MTGETTQTTAVMVGLSELIEKLREELNPQVHVTFTLDGRDPTMAFTLPDCASDDFERKLRELGDLTYLLTRMALRNREYDCEEDEGHSRWDASYA